MTRDVEHQMFEQERIVLERAQATYRNVLKEIDAKLRAAVSRDPACVDEAEALQFTYRDFGREPLRAPAEPGQTEAATIVSLDDEIATVEQLLAHLKAERGDATDVVTDKAAIEDALKDTTEAAGADGAVAADSPEGQQ